MHPKKTKTYRVRVELSGCAGKVFLCIVINVLTWTSRQAIPLSNSHLEGDGFNLIFFTPA